MEPTGGLHVQQGTEALPETSHGREAIAIFDAPEEYVVAAPARPLPMDGPLHIRYLRQAKNALRRVLRREPTPAVQSLAQASALFVAVCHGAFLAPVPPGGIPAEIFILTLKIAYWLRDPLKTLKRVLLDTLW